MGSTLPESHVRRAVVSLEANKYKIGFSSINNLVSVAISPAEGAGYASTR